MNLTGICTLHSFLCHSPGFIFLCPRVHVPEIFSEMFDVSLELMEMSLN